MNVRLMYPARDFDENVGPPPQAGDVEQDLALGTLLGAMAGDDPFLLSVARAALFSGSANDLEVIAYRQEVMRDCVANASVVRDLYAVAVEAVDQRRRGYFGYLARSPGTLLYGSVDLLERFAELLLHVRQAADLHGSRFTSAGFSALFAAQQRELGDEYLASVRQHLATLRFAHGVLVSAGLGVRNEGRDYVLRLPGDSRPRWLQRIVGRAPRGYSFRIDERDEAGARALAELHDRGIDEVANVVAQAAEHVLAFFQALRTELAFYVSCLNLHDHLTRLQAPVCWPRAAAPGTRRLCATGLYDACLALRMERPPVPNAIDADGKGLVVITGANQGGKSSLLRAIGLAQLMMQAGMFVGAETFEADTCSTLFTHYRREEDATMVMGKLDEELARLSTIVDAIRPDAMLLLNESFAATNEREGSEIARQVVATMVANGVKVVFVTHLYDFAHRLAAEGRDDALFLRAERRDDGTRTFRIVPGAPLETSYGEDLYRKIFVSGGD